jgi:acyl-CoA thioester hydrolase
VTAERPFRYRLRVRYGECDAQGIVFNARWVEYVDIAVTEYTRALFGSVHPAESGLDWRLVTQTMTWKSPGRYDDVLEASIRTLKIGTTSFTIGCEWRRAGSEEVMVTAETIYVRIDLARGLKAPLDERHRTALERGASGIVVDHAGIAPA